MVLEVNRIVILISQSIFHCTKELFSYVHWGTSQTISPNFMEIGKQTFSEVQCILIGALEFFGGW